MTNERDGIGRGRPCRVERMRAIRQYEHQIHLRAQVDEIPRPFSARRPEEASVSVQRYRGKKRHTGWNISQAEPDLRSGCEEILMRVARGRAEG